MHAPVRRTADSPLRPLRAHSRTPDRGALYLAAFGACVAIVAWLAIGALTGLGKYWALLVPGSFVAAIVGALLASTRFAILLWIGALAAVGLFSLVALTPFVTRGLRVRELVRSDKLPPQPLDAVIVLSGGVTADSLLRPEALDRLLTGVALMRDSVAPVLVVTQLAPGGDRNSAAADQARIRSLVSRPFPMLVVERVRTTRDEATGAWRLLRPRGATRVAVVTSPLHTHRACATFESVGFTVTCVPAVSREYTINRPITGQDRLVLFRTWLYERTAWAEYHWRGWVAEPRTR